MVARVAREAKRLEPQVLRYGFFFIYILFSLTRFYHHQVLPLPNLTQKHRLTTVNAGPRQPTQASRGLRQPTQANICQCRSMTAMQRRPMLCLRGGLETRHVSSPRYDFFFIYMLFTPLTFYNYQTLPLKANEGQHRPTTAMQANDGQHRPTTANAGQHRPITANYGQRRPT